MSISGVSTGQIQAQPAAQASSASSSIFGEIWDTINPLQHIPIVSSLYRSASDTSISSFANIAGSTIYGGPIGGAIAAVGEGVSKLGHAIFGDSKPATATASASGVTAAPVASVQASKLETASGTKPVQGHHHKFHATTQEWLNQTLAASDETSTASNISPATPTALASNTAAASYKKVDSISKAWLNPALTQLPVQKSA